MEGVSEHFPSILDTNPQLEVIFYGFNSKLIGMTINALIKTEYPGFPKGEMKGAKLNAFFQDQLSQCQQALPEISKKYGP